MMRYIIKYKLFEGSNFGIFQDTFCDIPDDLPVDITYSESELPGYQAKIAISNVQPGPGRVNLFKLFPIIKSKIEYLRGEGYDFDISLRYSGINPTEQSWYLSSFNINDLEMQVIYGTYKILIYVFK